MTKICFDDGNIRWYQLEGVDHASYHVCSVDVENSIVDVLFKFDANQRVILHRHHADYRTFVVQGELRLYRANGDLIEIRPVGSYVEGHAGGEPHTEGGGDQDAIVFFSNRGTDGMIYELLDDDMNTVATLGLHDFKALLEAQEPAVQPSRA
ncbi:regulator [Anderseniella sp. Alg231-50]|uniref:regulator n=1 Tax=Anderseniella sp. Alg231-50 TaxID=1922226 RepID=UPI000D562794